MPGPYIQDGHYVYGNCHIQPYPAYYNSSWFHRKPPRRLLSDLNFYDDGSVYVCDNKPADPDEPINRNSLAHSILNIETIAFRTLRIKLYAAKEENDTDIVLELGKGYSIKYVTEGGIRTATGILKIIDSSIPDTCVRYIGDFNETIATAWIGIDCSVVGKSDKRKIYIASIRAIEEADIEDPDFQYPEDDVEDMSLAQKLNTLLGLIPGLDGKLDKILTKVNDNDQIMDKLIEMDPASKLEYIIDQISANTELINNNINDKHQEAMDKFEEILTKLGSMPYDDKIDYLVNKIGDIHTESINQSASRDDKIQYIVNALENGVNISFLG